MRNHESAIGVFDSGIGGLTVLHEIIEALPRENTVYLGDTARSPYGTKSVDTVLRYSFENSEFLVEKGVKIVVVACNTSTAIALERLQSELDLPVVGVIHPGVRRALASTRNKKVGVIGTEATIQSGAYTRALKTADAAVEVYSRACPLFVPLVEEGWTDNAVVEMTVKAYLESLKQSGIDTLILGCTHYPLLKKAIRKFLGRRQARRFRRGDGRRGRGVAQEIRARAQGRQGGGIVFLSPTRRIASLKLAAAFSAKRSSRRCAS